MKQLSVGTFFSEPSGICHSEENIDNNVSARLAARIAGFTQQRHSILCAPSDDSQPCAKPPIHLEERGLCILVVLLIS